MTEHPPYTHDHPRSRAPGLVRCVNCGGRGAVKQYDVYRAARRSPYARRACGVCQGTGRSLPAPEPSSWSWIGVGWASLILLGLMALF